MHPAGLQTHRNFPPAPLCFHATCPFRCGKLIDAGAKPSWAYFQSPPPPMPSSLKPPYSTPVRHIAQLECATSNQSCHLLYSSTQEAQEYAEPASFTRQPGVFSNF
eukprot:EG_transcript_52212